MERLWLCVTNLQERLGLLPSELPLKEKEENKEEEEEEVSGLHWPEQRTKSKNKRGKSISHGKLSKQKVAKPVPAAFSDCKGEDKVATFIAGGGREGKARSLGGHLRKAFK